MTVKVRQIVEVPPQLGEPRPVFILAEARHGERADKRSLLTRRLHTDFGRDLSDVLDGASQQGRARGWRDEERHIGAALIHPGIREPQQRLTPRQVQRRRWAPITP
jgi:hypothetical protein